MEEETIGRISNLQGLVTLTLDRVILNTVMHQSTTSTYIPNVVEINKLFEDGWTGRRTTRRSRPKNAVHISIVPKSSASKVSSADHLSGIYRKERM